MIAVLLVLAPTLGAPVVVLLGRHRPAAVRLVGCGALLISWGLALTLAFGHLGDAAPGADSLSPIRPGGPPITAAVVVDPLAAAMLLLVTTVALLVSTYSEAYLATDPRYPSYQALILLFTAAMALVVVADDLFVLLVGWEVMGACSYFLIAHHWERAPARAGAAKAFLMTRLADVGLLFGIFVAGRAAGTYRISGILDAVAAGTIGRAQATTAALLLLCGALGKSAQFPLHSWLPDAMPGPTPISALIHAATMVAAGVYLVARMLPLFEISRTALTVLAVVAAITMLGGAAFAFAAEDLKRVLAWSTVSQLAYMFGGLALGGRAPAILHLLAHGAFKALLFLAAGVVIAAAGRQRLGELGGLRGVLPFTFAMMTVGLAALAGVPPLAGFFSKDAILGLAAAQAADGSGRAWLVLVAGLVTAALTAAYATRVWLMVFFGARPDSLPDGAVEPPWLMTAPMLVLGVISAVGGIAVLRPRFLAVRAEPLQWVAVGLGLLALVIGAASAYLLWRRLGDPARVLGRLRPALEGGLWYDPWVVGSLTGLVRTSSRAAIGSEYEVIAPYVTGTEATAQLAGRSLRRLHAGNVAHYLATLVVGAVVVATVVGALTR